MTAQPRKYPVGVQDFKVLREEEMTYVDKTALVYKMTHRGPKTIFLSRPRRFGKSLLVSTLEYYFRGERELFKGLAIESLETEWKQYPVISLSLSQAKHDDEAEFEKLLRNAVKNAAENANIEYELDTNPALCLANLIACAYAKHQCKVVILIDEYDAPLLDVFADDTKLEQRRKTLKNFFSPIKDLYRKIHFVFVTGITKFSQVSIFSELNNLVNISMEPDNAAICGVTEEEIDRYLGEDIDLLTQKVNEQRDLNLTSDNIRALLKKKYDGYHFSWKSPDVYNPFSLLYALEQGELNNYWFESGTSAYIIDLLRRHNINLQDLGGEMLSQDVFNAPLQTHQSVTPLLYHGGYETIKSYDKATGLYTLDVPNNEVRIGIANLMLQTLTQSKQNSAAVATKLQVLIRQDKIEEAMQLLQTFMASLPYFDNARSEGHFQSIFYLIFTIMGVEIDVEVRTRAGRVDAVLKTETHIYIFEMKIGQSADAALRQIADRDYADRFALDGRPVVKVGVRFDPSEGVVKDWKVER